MMSRNGLRSGAARAAMSVSLCVGAFAATGVLAESTAEAQSLRPNILFIFDTSGSMLENSGGTWVGENTNICPGGDKSRIYNLKNAMRGALAQVGTDEANFGLMSFATQPLTPMAYPTTCTPNTGGNATCSGWCRTAMANNGSAGHYQPTPAHTGRNLGCDLSTHTNETTFGAWYTNAASEVLRVGVTSAAGAATPVAANFDPVDANIPSVYKWIDNVELPAGNGAVTDPELHGINYTPLGRSLFYARMYYDNLVKPNDPRATCRQNVVVLITDGAETCDTTEPTAASFNLTDCSGGGTYSAFHPVKQACDLLRTSKVKTYMITDSGLSANQLGAADRIAAAGGTTSAIRVSLADANAAKAALVGIIAETVPPVEVCNGKDDNCNGVIDEGVSNMCPLDVATLKHCAVETANCLDDNCNGLIDEGFPPNACGKGAGCPIPPEVCDGIDNDCDGDIDEGFDVGASCNNGLTGACRRVGIKECTPDKAGVMCTLGGASTATEICNGIDDDCNGQIDDGLGTGQGVGVDCGIQGQGCNKGITRCVGGKIVCDSTSSPQMETCNGKDDDCNGLVDDGVFPGVGESCICPGLDPAQVAVGTCRAGRKVCKGALGIQCEGCVLPQPEICNGKDDDCDGMSDHMATCPSGFGCRDGQCSILCRASEFPCPAGYDCVDTYCVPNRCKSVTCAIDQKCDNATGSCVDLCYKVSCLSGQTCRGGKCLDCENSPLLACSAGQLCVNRQCVTDACANVSCAADEYCSAGKCVSVSCGGAGCPDGQKCVSGQCRDYGCDKVACSTGGTYCDWATGTCKPDLCAAKTCPFCAKETGECTPDPCATIKCPGDCWSCRMTPAGDPYCDLSANCGYVKTIAASGGGGCSCQFDAAPMSPLSTSLLGLTIAGLLVVRGRRRKK